MRAAAAAEEFEQATLERNRLRAVRSLLERRRVANESVGTFDAVAVALDGRDANAQVFQVRDGVLSDRQSFYLANETERELAEVAEEFMLQYYGGHTSIPALLVVQRELDRAPGAGGGARQPPRRAGRAARGRARREAPDPRARRSATRGWRSTRSGCAPSAAARAASRRSRACRWRSGLDVPPIRIECFDISNLGGTHTVASMVVFEGGAPKKSDYRRFKIRSRRGRTRRLRGDGGGARAALRPVGAPGRHLPARPRLRRELRGAAEPGRDRRRQGSARRRAAARCAAFASAAWRSCRSPSASRRSSCPGRRAPLVLDHSTPELQLLQRVRDEAHRFAITHHRGRRDKAMTSSLLDELPGVGPARKRALLDALRLARGGRRRPRARSCRRCPACPRRSAARCTPTCTAPAEPGDSTEPFTQRPARPPARHNEGDGRDQAPAPAARRRPAKTAEPVIESRLQDLVVITGFSGAGKSTAMNVFEDAGYFCVDNLPPEMIRSLVELFVHKGSKVERAAVVSDVRGGVYFEALRAVSTTSTRSGYHHVLFLEASEQTLVTRYKETRRRHPLAPEGSVAAGVAAERALLEPLRGRADLVIDTTGDVGGDAARARSPTSSCRARRSGGWR